MLLLQISKRLSYHRHHLPFSPILDGFYQILVGNPEEIVVQITVTLIEKEKKIDLFTNEEITYWTYWKMTMNYLK